MKLFEKADDIMNDLGYELIEENKNGASYTRTELVFNDSGTMVHQIDLIRPSSDIYYVISYEKGFNSDLENNVVKLSNIEMAALQKKYRELCRKYGKV